MYDRVSFKGSTELYSGPAQFTYPVYIPGLHTLFSTWCGPSVCWPPPGTQFTYPVYIPILHTLFLHVQFTCSAYQRKWTSSGIFFRMGARSVQAVFMDTACRHLPVKWEDHDSFGRPQRCEEEVLHTWLPSSSPSARGCISSCNAWWALHTGNRHSDYQAIIVYILVSFCLHTLAVLCLKPKSSDEALVIWWNPSHLMKP